MKSEHVEQRELVSWFRKTYGPVRIFAIPNGGKRSKIEAGRLKAEGVTAGVPDLFVPAWGLWVEMKVEQGGKLDKKQKDWRGYLVGVGHGWIRGNGFEDAKNKIIEFNENMLK